MEKIQPIHHLGLALSGGGFRASFFHIGVLARMAELGMLKHVEVISTVSGGSIVGAAYYLLLKDLLEKKSDSDITNQDFADLVSRLEIHFLEAVQKNIRMRAFGNPFKPTLSLSPSLSDTIGDIYGKLIFQPILDVGGRRIEMTDLLINPKDVTGDFHPWDHANGNPARVNKVPILKLNATSLNNGRNWTFTSTDMGEVPARNLFLRSIDRKSRFKRFRYEDSANIKFNKFHLGRAVAASAGVPGLFPPLSVPYKGGRALLVDGGVFDNLGFSGLLDPGYPCTHFVISDASHQGETINFPSKDLIPVLLKSSEILGDRVREEMVNSILLNHEPNTAYFHLKSGLITSDIDSPIEPSFVTNLGIVPSEDEFDIAQEALKSLSQIRTDLDSFTDIEAGCLQACGFQISEPRLVKLNEFISPNRIAGNWQFRRYLAVLKMPELNIVRQLNLGKYRFFKPFLYVFTGAVGINKALGLLAVSLPFVISLIAIFMLLDWSLQTYLNMAAWDVLSDINSFREFLGALAPVIYVILASFTFSIIGEKLTLTKQDGTMNISIVFKLPMALIRILVLKIALPVIFFIPLNIYIRTVDRYFTKVMGKLD